MVLLLVYFILIASCDIISAQDSGGTVVLQGEVTPEKYFTYNSSNLGLFTDFKIDLKFKNFSDSEVPFISTLSTNGVLDVSLKRGSGIQKVWRNVPGFKISRYFCLNSGEDNIYLETSTFNQTGIDFLVVVKLVNINIELNNPSKRTVYNGSPIVLKFAPPPLTPRFPFDKWIPEDRRFNVVVRSESLDTCGIVALQALTCPFHDVESDAVFLTKWQSFSGLSAIGVRFKEGKYEKYIKGFYVVIMVESNSTLCDQNSIAFQRVPKRGDIPVQKIVSVEVEEMTFSPLGISIGVVFLYIIVYGIGLSVTVFCNLPVEGIVAKRAKKKTPEPKSPDDSVEEGHNILTRLGDSPDHSKELVTKTEVSTSVSDLKPFLVKEVVILNKEEIKVLRSKKDLTVGDLAIQCDHSKFPNTLHMKSSLYVWIIFLMGIFYTLPVFQLVKNYEKLSKESGNENICYYNFLCKIQWATLEDYGHVFSNVGYVISGLTFNCIVYLRRKRYNSFVQKTGPRLGIPEQYGVFFAMGGALCMEGILSGCYHICPTAENFQFDTTFMYVLAVLVFLKVFQFRHPDITANAYTVFSVIGGALVFEVLGVYLSNAFFWIVFLSCYVTVVVYFVIQTYYNGLWDSFKDAWQDIFRKLYRERTPPQFKELSPMRKGKFIASLIIILVNVSLAIFFAYKRKPGVSRYLLLILMSNMALYVAYYVCMKLHHRFILGKKSEALNLVCVGYIFAMFLCIISSVTFFVLESKNSSRTPANSRLLNAPCTLSIFDNHDLWHFLSAAGLFFHFMMILTLEDNNIDTPWEEIPVF